MPKTLITALNSVGHVPTEKDAVIRQMRRERAICSRFRKHRYLVDDGRSDLALQTRILCQYTSGFLDDLVIYWNRKGKGTQPKILRLVRARSGYLKSTASHRRPCQTGVTRQSDPLSSSPNLLQKPVGPGTPLALRRDSLYSSSQAVWTPVGWAGAPISTGAAQWSFRTAVPRQRSSFAL